MNKYILSSATIILLGLTGCSAIPLNPNAERVLVSPDKPDSNCKFIGQIRGSQGGAFSGPFTSNDNLNDGAMNQLRNNAAAKGANYVQLLTNRSANTISGGSGADGGGISGEQTSTYLNGNAYSCPENNNNSQASS